MYVVWITTVMNVVWIVMICWLDGGGNDHGYNVDRNVCLVVMSRMISNRWKFELHQENIKNLTGACSMVSGINKPGTNI